MPATRLLTEHNAELASQWHPVRNISSGLQLATIAVSSGKKAWWLCPQCAYEWQASVASRNSGRGCPRCAGRVVSDETSLLLNHPAIAAEYHRTRNPRPIEAVTSRTTTRCWWQCSLDSTHQWQTSPLNRVKQGDGCPYCGGRFATAEWNLGVVHPDLASEFDYEANYPLMPFDFTPKSNRKCHWKCAAGHRSFLTPASRMRGEKMQQCAKCVRHVATPETCILVTHPSVAAEYDGEKNAVLVEDVLSGSATKRWWKCTEGHRWEATPAARSRSNRPSGCPECSSTPRTSRVEQQLREQIKQGGLITKVPDTYNAFLPVRSGKQKSMQVDIFGEYADKPIVIEWDSWWWHSGAGSRQNYSVPAERDLRKTRALLAAGYVVVRIREERLGVSLPLLEVKHENLLQLRYNYMRDGAAFGPMLTQLYEWLAS